jgi:hypothetical protein
MLHGKGSITPAFFMCVLGVHFTVECVFNEINFHCRMSITHFVATDGETHTHNVYIQNASVLDP